MPSSPAEGSMSVIFQADLPSVGWAEVYTSPAMSAATQKLALGHDMPVMVVELRVGQLAVTFQTDFAPAAGLVETRISPGAPITQSLRLGHEILPTGTWVVAATQARGPPAGFVDVKTWSRPPPAGTSARQNVLDWQVRNSICLRGAMSAAVQVAGAAPGSVVAKTLPTRSPATHRLALGHDTLSMRFLCANGACSTRTGAVHASGGPVCAFATGANRPIGAQASVAAAEQSSVSLKLPLVVPAGRRLRRSRVLIRRLHVWVEPSPE